MTLKTFILLAGFLGLAGAVSAQKQPEKYCVVNLDQRFRYIEVTVDMGKDSALAIQDTVLKNDLKRMNKSRFKSTVDILNYMSSRGWAFVTTSHLLSGTYEFYFKRRED